MGGDSKRIKPKPSKAIGKPVKPNSFKSVKTARTYPDDSWLQAYFQRRGLRRAGLHPIPSPPPTTVSAPNAKNKSRRPPRSPTRNIPEDLHIEKARNRAMARRHLQTFLRTPSERAAANASDKKAPKGQVTRDM